LILHGFFRSTASWRVRIALGLKGLSAEQVSLTLRDGHQRRPDYLALNPQGLVPALTLDNGVVLTQSLAICEYLDETYLTPPLLPATALGRTQVRAVAQVIACDIHPIQNLKILARLRAYGLDEAATQAWARETIDEELNAVADLVAGSAGPFCFGSAPSLADICLVPQLGNARRFGVTLRWPKLLEIEAVCRALPAFAAAAPELQPDAA
jgi:maleylpyruvate isomerase